jgi:Zn-dependent protease with chaperone function
VTYYDSGWEFLLFLVSSLVVYARDCSCNAGRDPYIITDEEETIEDEEHASGAGVSVFWNVLHEIAEADGLPRCPKAVFRRTPECLSIMQRRGDDHYYAVTVSEGLLRWFNEIELKAILAHEIAHGDDGDWDDCLVRIVSFVRSSLALFGCALLFLMLLAFGPWGIDPLGSSLSAAAQTIFWSYCLSVGYLIGPRLHAFIRQRREIRADLIGSRKMGSVMPLKGALMKICPWRSELTWKDRIFYKVEHNTHPSLKTRFKHMNSISNLDLRIREWAEKQSNVTD